MRHPLKAALCSLAGAAITWFATGCSTTDEPDSREERMYAAGKIPGSFFRREGRPSTEAILACRLIDRPLRRPLKKVGRSGP